MRNKRGFTVIELLVVIAIIMLLASIIMVATASTRQQGRTAKRYGDLQQVQSALELYFEQNGSYPSTGGQWWTVCNNTNSTSINTVISDTSGPTGYIPNLAPDYIPVLATDPSGCVGGLYKGYIYMSDGVDYKFATDYTAELGYECGVGGRFADKNPTRIPTGSESGFCSVYTPAAAAW